MRLSGSDVTSTNIGGWHGQGEIVGLLEEGKKQSTTLFMNELRSDSCLLAVWGPNC